MRKTIIITVLLLLSNTFLLSQQRSLRISDHWNQKHVFKLDDIRKIVFKTRLAAEEKPSETVTESVFIYPNPAADKATIELPENADAAFAPDRIEIFNCFGQLIRELNIESSAKKITWDLCDNLGRPVTNGSYFCKIENQNKLKISIILVVR